MKILKEPWVYKKDFPARRVNTQPDFLYLYKNNKIIYRSNYGIKSICKICNRPYRPWWTTKKIWNMLYIKYRKFEICVRCFRKLVK